MNPELQDIVYITLPSSMAKSIGDFKIDPARRLPLQLPAGKKNLDGNEEITLAMIVSGMLKIIAWEPSNPNYEYYKAFVLASEPDVVRQLNLAAIAQEKKGNVKFSEELFVTVNRLAPQSATFINLATFYSSRAAEDKSKSASYDMYAQKALDTLREGLKLFPKDPDLLAETGSFHLYQGNVETARNFYERYLAVAPKGAKRDKIEKLFMDIDRKISSNTSLMSVYDKIQMGEEEKAIEEADTFLKANPNVWNALFLKGWALRKLQHFAEAKDCLMECLKTGERDADIYNELSLCEYALHNDQLAKDYLDIAVDLDGENITYLCNLAYMLLKDKDYTEARRRLETARSLDENDPLVIELMKHYQEETGDTLADTIVEQVVDDETMKMVVKSHDEEETRHDFAAHREDMETEDEDGCCHHHEE